MNRRSFIGFASGGFVAAPTLAFAPPAAPAAPPLVAPRLDPINITLRIEKGAPLTALEVDDNFRRIVERLHNLERHRP